MINIDIIRHDDYIETIIVKDHANSGDYGFDLVCAGVSAIMIGALNAFDQMNFSGDLDMDERPKIKITSDKLKENQKYMEIIYYQLKTIQEQYSEYINIIER